MKLQCLKEVVKQKAILHFLENKAFAGFPHGQEKSGKTKKNDKSQVKMRVLKKVRKKFLKKTRFRQFKFTEFLIFKSLRIVKN